MTPEKTERQRLKKIVNHDHEEALCLHEQLLKSMLHSTQDSFIKHSLSMRLHALIGYNYHLEELDDHYDWEEKLNYEEHLESYLDAFIEAEYAGRPIYQYN